MSGYPADVEKILRALADNARSKLSRFEAEDARYGSTPNPEVDLAYATADEARISLMKALRAVNGGVGHYDQYETEATRLIEQAKDDTLRHQLGVANYGWSWRDGGWAERMSATKNP